MKKQRKKQQWAHELLLFLHQSDLPREKTPNFWNAGGALQVAIQKPFISVVCLAKE